MAGFASHFYRCHCVVVFVERQLVNNLYNSLSDVNKCINNANNHPHNIPKCAQSLFKNIELKHWLTLNR